MLGVAMTLLLGAGLPLGELLLVGLARPGTADNLWKSVQPTLREHAQQSLMK